MTRNIAIVGKMYAGKTTLANQLVEAHGYRRMLMAGPLKELAHRAYGEEIQKDKNYEVRDLKDGSLETKTGRQILQGIGQSIKTVDRDIWLKIFHNDAARQLQIDGLTPAQIVVDDVRFKFEADYLHSQGWYVVRVYTPVEIRIARAVAMTGVAPTAEELDHESEREVDLIDSNYLHQGADPLDRLALTAKNIVDLASR